MCRCLFEKGFQRQAGRCVSPDGGGLLLLLNLPACRGFLLILYSSFFSTLLYARADRDNPVVFLDISVAFPDIYVAMDHGISPRHFCRVKIF